MQKQFEALGHLWQTVMKDPKIELPVMIPYVVKEGLTREAWQVKTDKQETMLIAWPKDAPFRAGITVQGKPEGKLDTKTCTPLLEGFANDLTVDEVKPWSSGVEAYFTAFRNEDKQALCFYNPLYFRDKQDLTPGVRQSFVVSGLASALRRGLLDDMHVTKGPLFENYIASWLEENPGSSRHEAPQLSIDLRGERILIPSDFPGNYQMRCPISTVDTCQFADELIYVLGIELGLNTENPLRFILYAPEKICHNITPKVGDEIDALIWLQARVVDSE